MGCDEGIGGRVRSSRPGFGLGGGVILVAINIERRRKFGLRDLLLKINSAATAR